MRCAACNAGTAKPADVELRREIDGHLFTAAVRGFRCEACGEEIYEALDIERFDAAVALALARSGAGGGEVFRLMRKVIGLRAADLAELLGVAPETLSRWETGKHPIDHGALALLSLLVIDHTQGVTSTLDALRDRAHPQPLDKRIALELAS